MSKLNQPQSQVQQEEYLVKIGRQLEQEKQFSILNLKGGKGGFGDIIFIYDPIRKRECAIKIISIFDGVDQNCLKKLEEAKKEAQILKECNHSHIVEYIDDFILGHNYFIQMEKCIMTLHDWEENIYGKQLNIQLYIIFFIQTLNAIKFLHSKNYVMRDISLKNILIDNSLSIKLCDFGMARQAGLEQLLETVKHTKVKGTLIYFPPEVMSFIQKKHKQKKYFTQTQAGDIWAFGVCMYVLAGANIQHIIKFAQQTESYQYQKSIGLQLNNLIKDILQINPDSRLSIDKILSKLQEALYQKDLLNIQQNSINLDQIQIQTNSQVTQSNQQKEINIFEQSKQNHIQPEKDLKQKQSQNISIENHKQIQAGIEQNNKQSQVNLSNNEIIMFSQNKNLFQNENSSKNVLNKQVDNKNENIFQQQMNQTNINNQNQNKNKQYNSAILFQNQSNQQDFKFSQQQISKSNQYNLSENYQNQQNQQNILNSNSNKNNSNENNKNQQNQQNIFNIQQNMSSLQQNLDLQENLDQQNNFNSQQNLDQLQNQTFNDNKEINLNQNENNSKNDLKAKQNPHEEIANANQVALEINDDSNAVPNSHKYQNSQTQNKQKKVSYCIQFEQELKQEIKNCVSLKYITKSILGTFILPFAIILYILNLPIHYFRKNRNKEVILKIILILFIIFQLALNIMSCVQFKQIKNILSQDSAELNNLSDIVEKNIKMESSNICTVIQIVSPTEKYFLCQVALLYNTSSHLLMNFSEKKYSISSEDQLQNIDSCLIVDFNAGNSQIQSQLITVNTCIKDILTKQYFDQGNKSIYVFKMWKINSENIAFNLVSMGTSEYLIKLYSFLNAYIDGIKRSDFESESIDKYEDMVFSQFTIYYVFQFIGILLILINLILYKKFQIFSYTFIYFLFTQFIFLVIEIIIFIIANVSSQEDFIQDLSEKRYQPVLLTIYLILLLYFLLFRQVITKKQQ